MPGWWLLVACGERGAEPVRAPDLGPPAEEDCDRVKLYQDSDGDGYGVYGQAREVCAGEPGWSERGGDCDDYDAAFFPDAPELCNGLDDDCNPTTPEVAQVGERAFATVGLAIEAATGGEIVTVCAGEHPAHGLRIDHDLVVVGATGDPADVTLDAQGQGSVFEVGGGALVLEGLTLTGADSAEGPGSYTTGGAVGGPSDFAESPVTLRRCVIEDNHSEHLSGGLNARVLVLEDSVVRKNTSTWGAGGIHVPEGGSLTLTRSLIELNEGDPGGIYTASPTTVTESELLYNTGGYLGGALFVGGEEPVELTLEGTTFADNFGFWGGAVVTGAVLVTADEGTTFRGNLAGQGGAVSMQPGAPSRWTGGLFHDNRADQGGAFYVWSPVSVELDGLVMEDNRADDEGGGAYLVFKYGRSPDAVLSLRDSVVQDNRADLGGGLYTSGLNLPLGRVELENVLLLDNTAESGGGLLLDYDVLVSLQSCDVGPNVPDDVVVHERSYSGWAPAVTLTCSTESGLCE